MLRKKKVVKRKAHNRRGYRRRNGVYVKPTRVKSSVFLREHHFSNKLSALTKESPEKITQVLNNLTIQEIRTLIGPLLTPKERILRKNKMSELIIFKLKKIDGEGKWVQERNLFQ